MQQLLRDLINFCDAGLNESNDIPRILSPGTGDNEHAQLMHIDRSTIKLLS